MNERNCKCHHVLMREADGQAHTIACEIEHSDPSKKLMGKRVTIKQYIGDQYNEEGYVRGYDPKNGKWWVTNWNMPFQGTVSDWFSEEELIVQ